MSSLMVIAGPNGSGKSTIHKGMQDISPGKYINPDMIQRRLGCSAQKAAQNAAETREYCLEKRADFTFETVLSRDDKIDFMRRGLGPGL